MTWGKTFFVRKGSLLSRGGIFTALVNNLTKPKEIKLF